MWQGLLGHGVHRGPDPAHGPNFTHYCHSSQSVECVSGLNNLYAIPFHPIQVPKKAMNTKGGLALLLSIKGKVIVCSVIISIGGF